MVRIYLFVLLLMVSFRGIGQNETTLKEAYKGEFLIGVALDTKMVDSDDPKIQKTIKSQFNSIVAENCMKFEEIQPKEGVFKFEQADRFMKLGEENDMFIVGHNLVWHSQVPDWLFLDEKGGTVSREVLIERMRKHIYTLVGRYKGRVHGWDVVNEAINGSDGWRDSKWKQIIGKEYIELAFQFAHEADPDAQLYYNDYSLNEPKKRGHAVELIKRLQEKGIPIHGIGMQGHYNLNTDISEVENSIIAFSNLGIKVMFTEIDIDVLPNPAKIATAEVSTNFEYEKKYNPYPNGLPDSVQQELTAKYESLFKVLLKHEDVIERVTFWGLNDGVSWKNDWPIKGRINYPLLFDRENNPKPAFHAVVKLAN